MTSPFKVRVVSPWGKQVELDDTVFDSRIEAAEADALLCFWAPSRELNSFAGPKGWYCPEPEVNIRQIDGGCWPAVRDALPASEFFFHGHPDESFRVPVVSHHPPLVMNCRADRVARAVAVVSNFGGEPRERYADIRVRNVAVTLPLVDLFGSSSWHRYRRAWYSPAGAPANYRGEVPGEWHATEKRELLSRYKVCVCLENVLERNYFTEKFVEAVAAGCVPVYQAHPSVRNSILREALYVDLADCRGDPRKAVEEALNMDLTKVQQVNGLWLKSQQLAATSNQAVFARIAAILKKKSRSAVRGGERRQYGATCSDRNWTG